MFGDGVGLVLDRFTSNDLTIRATRRWSPSAVEYPKAKAQVLPEVSTCEGPVTLSVPATLSPENYQDVADRIEILLRVLERRSAAAQSASAKVRRS